MVVFHVSTFILQLHQADGVFCFGMGIWMVRFEPIAVQYAGGILLPPVQKLVATMISDSR